MSPSQYCLHDGDVVILEERDLEIAYECLECLKRFTEIQVH